VWYPAIELSDTTWSAGIPQIALSGEDTVHLVWVTDKDTIGIKRLPYARSTDGGQTFSPTRELLPDSSAFPLRANYPYVIANGSYVFVLFMNPEPPYPFTSPLRMVMSIDGGSIFDRGRNITSQHNFGLSSISITGDTIAGLVIMNGRRVIRSTDRGLTWSIANDSLNAFARISLTPQGLHLVQHGVPTTAAEIEYRRSTNLGDSWEKDTLLSTNDTIFSDIPTIAAYQTKCGTELLVAWRDEKYGFSFAGASIISRSSITGGDSWLPENILTIAPRGTEPHAAVHGNTRAVSWWDAFQGLIFDGNIRASNSSLDNLCPAKNLAPPGDHGGAPYAIAVSSHAIHVAYEQNLGGNSGKFGVFYRRGEFIQSNAGFSLSTGLLVIDSTEINKTRRDSVTVNNTGTDPLVIGTATGNDENFSITPEAYTVPPTASHSFAIHFTPRSFGFHSGKMLFYHTGQSSPDCFQVTGVGKYTLDTIRYKAGAWNMVSAPVKPPAQTALPSLFSYEGGYSREYSMTLGRGYWAKPESASVVYRGTWTVFESVQVKKGWNMIGGLSVPMPNVYIYPAPDSIYFQSQYFNYNDTTGYNRSDTLFPGKSYWVKMSGDGNLILDARFLPPAHRQEVVNWKGEKPAEPKTRVR
jgi:hypothetical protein